MESVLESVLEPAGENSTGLAGLDWPTGTVSQPARVSLSAGFWLGWLDLQRGNTQDDGRAGHCGAGFQGSVHTGHTRPWVQRPTPGSPERTKVKHIKY